MSIIGYNLIIEKGGNIKPDKQNKREKPNKPKKGGKMGKIIFCVVIAELCFGQGIWLKENPKIPLPVPIDASMKSAYGENAIAMKGISFYSSNYTSQLNNLHYLLLSQVEGDSVKPKNSFWKQISIYGLEFVGGAGIGTATAIYLAYVAEGGGDFDRPTYAVLGYSTGHILFTSSCTWITGKLLGQKGSWQKSSLGAGLGCLIGISAALFLSKKYPEGFMNGVALGIFLVTPPSGAVIGYNIK